MDKYYYKSINGNDYLVLKTQCENEGFIQITEEQFNEAQNVCEELDDETKEKSEKFDEINELKKNLKETDYQAIKWCEGELTDEEYANTKIQRQQWRNRINELQEQLENI